MIVYPKCKKDGIKLWQVMFSRAYCTKCSSLIVPHWFMEVLIYCVGFFGCFIGSIFLINALAISSIIPVIILWLGVWVLKAIIVPLEVKAN